MMPYYIDVDDHQALNEIEKVIFDNEAIRWTSMVGPWALYRAMRSAGIRVSIDGNGSDEQIGGYHYFVETAMDAAVRSFDLRRYLDLRNILAGLIGGTETSKYEGLSGDLRLATRVQLARLRLLEPLSATVAGIRSLPKRLRGAVAHSSINELLSCCKCPYRLYYDAADPRVAGMSSVQAAMFTWFHGSFLPTILGTFDRGSMSHGIEMRMPFMDWRLVTYSFALPETSKIGGGYTKRVLRHAMRGILPEPIRLRTKKIGFVEPMEFWARGALKPWLLDVCASRSFVESAVWNGAVARAAVERAVNGEASIDTVWPIINAYVLERSFKSRARESRISTLMSAERNLAPSWAS